MRRTVVAICSEALISCLGLATVVPEPSCERNIIPSPPAKSCLFCRILQCGFTIAVGCGSDYYERLTNPPAFVTWSYSCKRARTMSSPTDVSQPEGVPPSCQKNILLANRQIEGREWWLWGFAVIVTLSLTAAIIFLTF